jgi:uncharacterized protein (DUF4415 family)
MRESKRPLGSDLARLDATTDEDIARQIAEDPDAAPELTEEDLEHAELWEGNRYIGPARGGRPKGSGTREMVTLRLDKAVLAHFRAGGPGWQTRLNDALMALVPAAEEAAEAPAPRGASFVARGTKAEAVVLLKALDTEGKWRPASEIRKELRRVAWPKGTEFVDVVLVEDVVRGARPKTGARLVDQLLENYVGPPGAVKPRDERKSRRVSK